MRAARLIGHCYLVIAIVYTVLAFVWLEPLMFTVVIAATILWVTRRDPEQ